MDAERARIEELEDLVSHLRHDLRGAITPAALIADRLRQNADPAIQRAAATISASVQRILEKLDATYQLVPPHSSKGDGPVLGAGGRQS